MKAYLVATYEHHPLMRDVRDVLKFVGVEVTSHWIDQHGGTELEASTSEQLNKRPEACAKFAQVDLEDIDTADTVICFSGGKGRGGRHVEFGYALAKGKRVILVGARENVFHCLWQVEHYNSWPELVTVLAEEWNRSCQTIH